ncbi:MAG: diadenylate cyclase CdaA [Anaerolineae bacterium]|nr:diadenylate cyclase CdaA [Anaerolineae bacterium]MDW8171173.1 diadenylate cyclase CdaA [Anaerolineae bacterium]
MQELLWILGSFTLRDALDVTLVALLIFAIMLVLRGSLALSLARAGFLVVGLLLVASIFGFQALNWLITNAVVVLGLAVPVIFQPELRRALERMGRGGWFVRTAPNNDRDLVIQEVVRAAERLAERRHGALIVLARASALDEYISTGVRLNSVVRAELLLTIFWPKTELHDGAVIVDQSAHLASAACVLPLSASRNLPNPKMGTRHRAALGISEVSDAICVVVSEETGRISIAHDSKMTTRLDAERLRGILQVLYGLKPAARQPLTLDGLRGWVEARLAQWMPVHQQRGKA